MPTAASPTRHAESTGDDDDDRSSTSSSTSSEDNPYDDVTSALRSVTPQIRTLKDVAELIFSGKAKNVIVMAGAGISTSAGIPDFRSPETGLYANLEKLKLPRPEAVFELDYFRKRPEPFFTLAKDLYPGKYLPTPTHYFLQLLHTHSTLLRLYTQNIDTLETLAGIPPSLVVEAHGSFAKSRCLDCGAEVDGEWMKGKVRKGEVVRCVEEGASGKKKGKCGGLVKPDIVFFGEGLPKRFFDLAKTDFPKCDLLIVLGTSLQVRPFASLIDLVPSTSPRLLINREMVGAARGSWDDGFLFGGKGGYRDLFFEGDADDGAEELAGALGWGEELRGLMVGHRQDLKREWGLGDPADQVSPVDEAASSNEDEVKPTETIAELAKELGRVDLNPAMKGKELDQEDTADALQPAKRELTSL